MKLYLMLVSLSLLIATGCHSRYDPFPETFEAGSKKAFTSANIILNTGSWRLNDALIGTSAADHKDGHAALRLTGRGTATMNFDVAKNIGSVTIDHACYGTDPVATWQLWYSANSGGTWIQAGPTVTTSSTKLSTVAFSLRIKSPVRFQMRKLSGGRINIDNFNISTKTIAATAASALTETTTGGPATRDENLGMGNPSNAGVTNNDNYLLTKTQYTLSYNNTKGMANWVSWHLSTAWKGKSPRCNCFSSDPTLPTGFFKATTSHYTGTGFDRGHLCPSDDRDGSATDNAATFLMTNITPQAPVLNQQPWATLEAYCRTLITQGKELYIIAGSYGQSGTGSNGSATNTIASGHISVPAHFWKVVIVLPTGTGDAARVLIDTRIIAVDMPNLQTVGNHPWEYYRTSVRSIEAATGYNLLSNVAPSVQATIENATDNGPTE